MDELLYGDDGIEDRLARTGLLGRVGRGILRVLRCDRKDRNVELLENGIDLRALALEHRLEAVPELLVPAAHRDAHVVLEWDIAERVPRGERRQGQRHGRLL